MKALSHVHSIMRGSVAGLTYSANQFASIIGRARVAPVQPNTPGQQVVKGLLQYLSGAWVRETPANRQAWDDFAATCIYLGPLGSYSVPGRQMFLASMSLPGYINIRGLHAMDADFNAPIDSGWLSAGPITSVPPATGTGFGVSIENGGDTDIVALTFRSIGFAQTRNRFKGPWIYLTAQATLIATQTSGIQSFTGLTEDKVYFTCTRCVSADPPYKISGTLNMVRHIAVPAEP